MLKLLGLVAVRMTSKRLPRKAFRTIGSKTILEIIVEKLKVSGFDDFVICTTLEKQDSEIASWCDSLGVHCFRGEVDNVMKRFLDCAQLFPSEYIVRVTGDNPFTDFPSAMEMFETMKYEKADYARQMGVPLGTACEIIRLTALKELHERSRRPDLSEYMTYFFEKAPFIKKIFYEVGPALRMPDLRLTIDYERDLEFANTLVSHFKGKIPKLEEIVSHCSSLVNYPRHVEDLSVLSTIKNQIEFN